MSTSDADIEAAEAAASEPAKAAPAAAPLPKIESPIVPKQTIAGRALVAVVAIMTFLGSLTTGGVMLVRAAANEWQSEVAREVTIQVRPVAARAIEADVSKAAAIARAVAGVEEVRPYSKEESAALLEPWLGPGLSLDELPVPRLIVVRLASGAAPDLTQLRQTLANEVPPASLDDHRGFIARMRTMTRAALLGGITVLALVVIATVLSVTFATRGAMATNRPVIEVLHFIGAKDGFIASHFQRHFLALGLKGGAIGGGCAVLLFALGELASQWILGTEFDQTLFGRLSMGPAGYAAVLAQIALISFVTAATSRYTVNRTLDTIQ